MPLNWGVSGQVQASQEPLTYWKQQCALIDHNIFMKQIGVIVLILNHSELFWMTFLYLRWFLEFFHVWKHHFWIFKSNHFVWQGYHSKTFFSSQMFYYYLSMYMKNVFCIISRFFEQKDVVMSKNGDF